MPKTKIEWCDYTINPVKGLCPVACDYCYARAMYKRCKWNPEIRWEPETLLELAVAPEGSKVFIGSTFELFHPSVLQHMDYILDCIKRAPWQTSILLTKQPRNLTKFNFPDNCWVGVSATNRDKYIAACMHLGRIEAKVKYLSLEPLLDWVHVREVKPEKYLIENGIKQVIIGAQTSKSYWDLAATFLPSSPPEGRIMKYGNRWTLQPKMEWVSEIVEACGKAGIPVFLKDNLKPLIDKSPNIVGLTQYGSARLRQEVPNGK